MRNLRASGFLAAIGAFAVVGVVVAAPMFHEAKAGEYDPVKGNLVQAMWLSGTGCPTNATTTTDGTTKTTYTDPACTTGDPKDKTNQGLLFAKTGPTSDYAEPYAELRDIKGVAITELGYDIRKPDGSASARGSQCGADAPMFQLQTKSGDVYYVACSSPAPDTQTVGNGWLRLRWGGSTPVMAYKNGSTLTDITGMTFDSGFIVFQDGQDAGPTNFGLAVIDNIDVSGNLVGQGAGN